MPSFRIARGQTKKNGIIASVIQNYYRTEPRCCFPYLQNRTVRCGAALLRGPDFVSRIVRCAAVLRGPDFVLRIVRCAALLRGPDFVSGIARCGAVRFRILAGGAVTTGKGGTAPWEKHAALRNLKTFQRCFFFGRSDGAVGCGFCFANVRCAAVQISVVDCHTVPRGAVRIFVVDYQTVPLWCGSC